MCEWYGVDYPEFWNERWVKAKKARRCPICSEHISIGHFYHVSVGKWNGEFRQYVHCARCWEMYSQLSGRLEGEVALELDCGEVYEGDDPEMLALAFLTPAEAQAFALERCAMKAVS